MFKVILEKEPNAILLLIGDGELESKMKQKALDLKIEKNILFMGNISNVNEMYQAMDIFLLPSLFEGLPVVGIEAQAAGLKCFFSDNVTKEVELTKNVKFLGLNNSLDIWADEILKCINYKRCNTSSAIKEAGYSIKDEAQKLQNIYLNFSCEK